MDNDGTSGNIVLAFGQRKSRYRQFLMRRTISRCLKVSKVSGVNGSQTALSNLTMVMLIGIKVRSGCFARIRTIPYFVNMKSVLTGR